MAEFILPSGAGCSVTTGRRSIDCSFYLGMDYTSPGKSIIASIEQAEEELRFGTGKDELVVPANSKYLEVHFSPPNGHVRVVEGEYRKVARNLRVGLFDYIHFLKTLQKRRKFKDIRLISGSTNPQLMHVAVNKLGFHLNTTQVNLAKELADPDGIISLYGILDELVSRLPFLTSLRTKPQG